MTIKTKETRGKPPRYLGEKSERISVLVRPRYRQALDIIAKDRGTTLSEAMELAISKLAREIKLEQDAGDKETPFIIDYVRPPYEPLERIYFAYIRKSKIINAFRPHQVHPYDEIMNKLTDIPAPLRTPLDNHIGDIIYEIKDDLDGFSTVFLLEAIEEDWKEGIPPEDTQRNIQIVNWFYNEMYFEKFWELNGKPNTNASSSEMKEYLNNMIDPFDHEDLSTEKVLEMLHEYHQQNF